MREFHCLEQAYLASSNKTSDFFREALEDALNLAGAEEGGIVLRNDRTGELRVEVFIGEGVQNKKRILSPNPQDSVCATAASQCETVNITDVTSDIRFHPLSNSIIMSEIVVPIVYANNCDGLLNLESQRLNAFSSDVQQSLEEFAKLISPAFHSALIDRHRYFLEQQLEASRAITEFTLRHSESPSLVLQRILDYSLLLTEADTGGILILSDDRESLELKAHRGLKPIFDNIKLNRGQGFVWQCMQENRPLNVWNVHEMSGVFKDLSAPKINSELAVPLSIGDEAIGVINIESCDYNAFSFEHVQTLSMFAQQVSLLIELTQIKKRWEGSWAVARWGDLSRNLSHRLNNLIGGVEVLASRMETIGTDPSMHRYAKRIKESSRQALDVIKDYRTKFEWQEDYVDVCSLVTDTISQITSSDGIHVTVEVPEVPMTIRLPERQFRELCRELIGNSMKSIGEIGSIEVHLRFRWGVLVLDFMDSGLGFPSVDRDDFFHLGYRGSSESLGTGYGLWWAQQFIHALGGEISLFNQPEGGAHVRVTIPLPGQDQSKEDRNDDKGPC